MKRKLLMLIMIAALAVVPRLFAAEDTRIQATAGVQPEKHWHEIDAEWLNKFHNPAPGIEMGLDFRFRTIHGKNFIGLDDNFGDTGANPETRNANHWNFERYRARWWANFELSPDVMLNTRLVWEFRTWRNPPSKPQHVELDEILFDRLNITWKNAFDAPLDLVIGRQDIILGRGWLVLDGTPLDGSRTIFFDAIRATYNCEQTSTVYDIIYINQDAELDHRIMPFNDQDVPVMEQDERGFILQGSHTTADNSKVDGYYIYKEDKMSVYGITGTRDAELHTLGARLTGAWDNNWAYYLEGAKQWGKKNMASVNAYGVNSRLTYNFNDEFKSSLRTGFEYLSGDDPDSSSDESFDLLWGRWPQWSELYIYSFASETRIAQVTNLYRFNVGHTFIPAEKWSVDTDYHLLWADENTYGATSTRFTNSGKMRGQLLTCWVKYACCKNFSMHWLAEYFQPSDYYERGNRDHAVFLRFNVEYTF